MPFQAIPFRKTSHPADHDRGLFIARLNMMALCAVFVFLGAVVFGLI